MSLLSRLFPKKRAYLDKRDKCGNERWDVGDLAVCVSDNWYNPRPGVPQIGEYFTVDGVGDFVEHVEPAGVDVRSIWLFFEGKDSYYEAVSFRKVIPDTDAADEEFAAQIKRLGRVPVRSA